MIYFDNLNIKVEFSERIDLSQVRIFFIFGFRWVQFSYRQSSFLLL